MGTTMLKFYLNKLFKRHAKPTDELTPTDRFILDYINTKKRIDLDVKKAREMERRLSRNVNKDGILAGKVYVYKESPYTVKNAPRLEDIKRAGLEAELSKRGLISEQVKTKRDYGRIS